MTELTTYHLLVVVLVYIVHRKHARRPTAEMLPDTIRKMVTNALSPKPHPPFRLNTVWPYVGALLVLFYMGGRYWERIARMFLMFVVVRTLQIVINREQRWRTEYTTPLVCLTLLMSVYHHIIPVSHRHIIYAYMSAHAMTVLLAHPFHTTTSSIIDDLALSHLIFYLMK